SLMELGGGTTTELAKSLFPCIDEYKLKKDENKIRYRLNRMLKKDLLERNSYNYKVNVERVFLTDAVLQLGIGVDVSMGMILVIYPEGEELLMRQISFEEIHKNSNQIFGERINKKD
ncbi:unnamed protein product, partial [marine sediment metagenome]